MPFDLDLVPAFDDPDDSENVFFGLGLGLVLGLNRLKQWRGIATRCDQTVRNYHGDLPLTSLGLCTETQI